MRPPGDGADRWREAESVPISGLGCEEGLAVAGNVPSWWP